MIDAQMRGAWDVVVQKLRGFVARRVPPSDADDVLQEVLLRVHKSAASVEDDRFGAWVYAVARNAITDHFRRGARGPELDKREQVQDDEQAEQADARALVACIAPFIARLPSPYREAVTLVELEGLTQQAAAEMAGVSLSGMKSRVQRGRRMLRQMFEECCALTFDARGRVVAGASLQCGCDDGAACS